jgi:nucleoside-diphosphate-sugar epimerase
MNIVGVLGCGWLGVPLCDKLKKQNWEVRGSRRSEIGMLTLKERGIDAHQIELSKSSMTGSIKSFFKEMKTLVISIPPDKKENDFSQRIRQLLLILKTTSVKKIIFLSSTSVYGNTEGLFNEKSTINPKKISSKAIVETEQLISNHFIPSIIIRLGGLIGVDRNPVFQLQKKIISNPNGRINFIDQKDAIEGIMALLSNPEQEGIYNLVSPHHPIRKTYYKKMALKYGLPQPKFEKDTDPIVRIINGDKITNETSFKYSVVNMLI